MSRQFPSNKPSRKVEPVVQTEFERSARIERIQTLLSELRAVTDEARSEKPVAMKKGHLLYGLRRTFNYYPHVIARSRKTQELLQEASSILPTALTITSESGEGVDVSDLAEVFAMMNACDAGLKAIGTANRMQTVQTDMVDKAVLQALPSCDLRGQSLLMQAMAIAEVASPMAWFHLGEYVALKSGQDNLEEDIDTLTELAGAVSMVSELAGQEALERVEAGLKYRFGELSELSQRLLAWSVAEFGVPMQSVFGKPPFRIPEEDAKEVWGVFNELVAQPGVTTLCTYPVPLIQLKEALSPEVTEGLLRLADKESLWQPSARQGPGSPDPGAAVAGRPWSSLLSKPMHKEQFPVFAARSWVAEVFDIPVEFVEAIRLIRYRAGEAPSGVAADARPPSDASLWLSGQRVAAVMIQLRDIPDGAGGEIVFPQLGFAGEGGIRVPPAAAGSVLVWPTVDIAGKPESATARTALPVTKEGVVKYVAMTWIRLGPAPGEEGGAPL